MGTIESKPEVQRSERRHRIWMLVGLLVFAGALQGARGIWAPDEGRYTGVASTMLARGDWLTPRLNDEVVHFTKPPLTYWALAASIGVFGRHEWAARLPNTLAFALTVLLTGALARRLGFARPEWAALIQATSLLPFVAASVITTDTLLALWETLAVFGFVAWWWPTPAAGAEAPRRGLAGSPTFATLVLWLGFGLAFLTKGPPGLLPLLPLIVFSLWTRGHRGLRWFVDPLGLTLFAVAAFGWYAIQIHLRPDLLPYLLGHEVVGRVEGEHGRNPGWARLARTYLPMLLLAPLPWNLVAWRRRPRPESASPEVEEVGRFLVLWLVLPLAIFCLAESRLPFYLLPLAVPTSLLLARRLRTERSSEKLPDHPPQVALPSSSIRGKVLLVLWIAALLGIRAGSGLLSSPKDARPIAKRILEVMGHAPTEVVFVDQNPQWGLSFYLGANVESALELTAPHEEGRYRPISEPLADELDQREEDSLYLVPDHQAGLLEQTVEGSGWTITELGTVGRLRLFAAEPPSPEPPPRKRPRRRRPGPEPE